MYEIEWKGSPNYYSGWGKWKPMVIVNHISAGTMGSMDNHFANPKSKASAHFGVSREGKIHQYVRMTDRAWTQGLRQHEIKYATAPIVKQLNTDPNNYCISIEHEGYAGNGLDGSLTNEQFFASVWLHKYIQTKVQDILGVKIPFTPQHVIGHFQIDPIDKTFCPGVNFPWARLYNLLYKADRMTMNEFEEWLSYTKEKATLERAVAVRNRIEDLYSKINSKFHDDAVYKLNQIADDMEEKAIL